MKKAFVNTTFSVYGQYRVRLWCKLKQRWMVVTVDDCFPCKKGSAKPMFADPHGTELWVLVLEKAFAKFVGTYGCDRSPAAPPPTVRTVRSPLQGTRAIERVSAE